jgi:hypothetical protein
MKMKETPVWSHDCIVCTGEADEKVVELTFASREADEVDEAALGVLIRAAVALGLGR